ncbi:MAG: hypothetical protein HC904_08350 [Blastochloris sp.]|nr:hypothetical protein [Blastochloris sp.]
MKDRFCSWMVLTLLGAGSLGAQPWDYVYPATERDAFASAEFRLGWSGAGSPRAVIVVVGAQNEDTRAEAVGGRYAAVAAETQSAVLGCKFVNRPGLDFSQTERGGRTALLECLRSLARQSEALRDLDRANLIMVGNLAGAQFVYEFANSESNRVAGFVGVNPYYFNRPVTGGLRKIPGLFLTEKPNTM